jgi:hypothetical protein
MLASMDWWVVALIVVGIFDVDHCWQRSRHRDPRD